jgi:ribosomal protein S27AE
MERWKLECPNCGESALVEVGSYSGDQSYSDLNEDFAFFKVFVCPEHKGWVCANVSDRNFGGSCGRDGGKLEAFEISSGKCPRCGGAILSTKTGGTLVE